MRTVFLLMTLAFLPRAALAEAGSLFTSSIFSAPGSGLIPARAPADGNLEMAPSLFVGRAPRGLFGDPPAHEPVYEDEPVAALGGSGVEGLRAIIGSAESRRDGYDAVQHGARVKPGKKPTQMTLAEIYDWIAATPGQPHAIGRYQFIPVTLKRVAAKVGASPDARFSPQMQDRLADVLLAEAGFHRFRSGDLGRVAFMNNLAKIWAGLPNSTGKSHYEGYAGNAASMTWGRFDAAMRQVFPG